MTRNYECKRCREPQVQVLLTNRGGPRKYCPECVKKEKVDDTIFRREFKKREAAAARGGENVTSEV